MPNINIYLPRKYEQLLEERMNDGETIGGAAKRLLLGLLDGENNQANPDALVTLEEKILELEDKIQAKDPTPSDNINDDRLEKVEEELLRLNGHIATLQKNWDGAVGFGKRLTFQEEKLSELEGKLNVSRESMVALARRQDTLENLIKKKETPSLPRDYPKGLTHAELAEKLGKDRSTVSRWAKDKEKWPEGFMYSEDSKLWFSLED